MTNKREISRWMVWALLLLIWPVIVQAAVVTFHTEAPTPGGFDVANLIGASRDAYNVGTATNDSWDNDGTTYVAPDRPAQGQTFLTPGGDGFLLTGVWIRHVGYTENTMTGTDNNGTWYIMPVNGKLGIRITDPAVSGTTNFVLSSESYTITRNEPNVLPATNTNNANGSGTWIHFTLDTPVRVNGNKLYGYDVVSMAGNANMYFESLGIKDDAPGGNPYPAGTAYVSGNAGLPDNTLTTAPGDRVFVVELMSPYAAARPYPADKATDVSRDIDLSWTPGEGATKHNVYIGTDLAAVTAAGTAGAPGVSVYPGQDANTFDPGRLQFGQTYYWRVDEVSGSHVYQGPVWSFRVEPVGYPIINITATASSAGTGTGPENTINGSGMTGDLHGTDTKTMWLSASTPQPTWIRYDFDRVYKLYELWVWNHNSSYESMLGFGMKNAVIEYSSDGTTWTKLGDFVFTQAPGTEDYAHDTTVSFGGAAAKSVRITVGSTWGGGTRAGLSEVRFFYIPVIAREPKPATGSAGVDPTTLVLSWRAGREAATHNVYIGTDSNTVKAGTTPTGTSTTASYTPAGIQLGTTYYWRVDEVNTTATPSTWAGDVWSFSTPQYLVVDDMESYNDKTGTRIFDTWVDGYGTTINGSQVGYTTAPFAEQAVVHGGKQSMPLAYNNTGSITSDATRTFAAAQDWTVGGVKTLVLFFHGLAANNSAQLYVKINGTRVDYPGGVAGVTLPLWKQWNVDLTAISGLKAVKTLTIGVSGSGKGTLYFDDIRLYKSAPAVAQPTDPGTANLMAYYALDGDAKDSKGGYNGTLNNVTFANSMTGFGQAAVFNGTTGYIDLGATFGSGLIGKLTNSTFAVWVNYTGSGAVWQRVFDFGSSTTVYMFMATRNGASYPRFAIMGSGKAEVNATDSRVMSVGWHHLAGVVDASAVTIALYVDGSLVQGGVATTVLPKDMGATTNNWIGRSQFTADPYLNGSVDDLRIYNRVLSAGEVGYLAGDR